MGMSFLLEWKYLQRTVPGVGTLMGPIEEALREKFSPTLFGGEDINTNLRKILGHRVNNSGLGITDPRMLEESAYNTSKAASGKLVDYLSGGSALNCVGHRACVHGASVGSRKERKHVEIVDLDRRKELARGQERNRHHRAMRNQAWLSALLF